MLIASSQLVHSLFPVESADICLFTKDPQDEFEALIKQANIPGKIKVSLRHMCQQLTTVQVISCTKLRGEYKQFEARRKLCGMYDLFLADDRYSTYLD
jgi:ribosome biogenesis protein UTP30